MIRFVAENWNGSGSEMQIAVLGGTFDPIHSGHLLVVEEVRNRLNLDLVLFVPTGLPWLKADSPISAAEHRVEMVRLAISGRSYCKLSTIEIERSGPTYTVDTIAEIRSELRDNDEIFFILGWDNLSQLPQWHEPSQLVQICYLVAVPRPGTRKPNMKALESYVPGISQCVILLDRPKLDISASAIRDRIRRGLPILHLVPGVVNSYIQEHGLYKGT